MYTEAPFEEMTLDEFELMALDRLQVLRKIEDLKVRGVTTLLCLASLAGLSQVIDVNPSSPVQRLGCHPHCFVNLSAKWQRSTPLKQVRCTTAACSGGYRRLLKSPRRRELSALVLCTRSGAIMDSMKWISRFSR